MKAIEIRDHRPEGKRHDRKFFKRIASAVAFTLALATACGIGWYAARGWHTNRRRRKSPKYTMSKKGKPIGI